MRLRKMFSHLTVFFFLNHHFLRAGLKFLCMMIQIKYYRRKNYSVVDIFRKNVTNYPNKVCFIYENEEWTFTKVSFYK